MSDPIKIQFGLFIIMLASCGCDSSKKDIEGNSSQGKKSLNEASVEAGKHGTEVKDGDGFEFEFELPDTENNLVKSDDFHGKVLLVTVWGTWCAPCIEELPKLIRLKNEFKTQFEVVGINIENADDLASAQKLVNQKIEELGINFQCVIGDQTTLGKIKGFRGYPTNLILDHNGKVILHTGNLPYEKFKEFITQAIANIKDA